MQCTQKSEHPTCLRTPLNHLGVERSYLTSSSQFSLTMNPCATLHREQLILLCTLLCTAALLLTIETATYFSPPPVKTSSKDFSGERAFALLKEIVEQYPGRAWGTESTRLGMLRWEQYVQNLQTQFGDIEYELQNYSVLGNSNEMIFQGVKPVPTSIGAATLEPCYVSQSGYLERPCDIINLNVLIRGTGVTPPNRTIMFNAHLDAAVTRRHYEAGRLVEENTISPAASDDGSGSAIALELMRVIAGNRPEHDVLFSITDAEEMGLLGAIAFRQESVYRDVPSAVIVVEASGAAKTRGYVSRTNSVEMIKAYTRFAPLPTAVSFVNYLENLLQVGFTDSNIWARLGIHFIDIVYLEDRWAYHTTEDTLDRVTPGALQHSGENALAIIRGMIAEDLVPERFTPENDKVGVVGEVTNVYFEDPPYNSGAAFVSYFDNSVWIFESATSALVCCLVLGILLPVISISLVVVLLKDDYEFPLARDAAVFTGFMLMIYLTGSIVPVVLYVASAYWKTSDVWEYESTHQARLLLCVLAVILHYLVCAKLLVKYAMSRTAAEVVNAENSTSKAKVDANNEEDAATDTGVENLSLRVYIGVLCVQSLLLCVSAIAVIDFALMLFWGPVFLTCGLLAEVIFRKLGVPAYAVLIIRDLVAVFVPGLLTLWICTFLINVFPLYVDEYTLEFEGTDVGFAIPALVAVAVGAVVILFVPALVRLDAGILRWLIIAVAVLLLGFFIAVISL